MSPEIFLGHGAYYSSESVQRKTSTEDDCFREVSDMSTDDNYVGRKFSENSIFIPPPSAGVKVLISQLPYLEGCWFSKLLWIWGMRCQLDKWKCQNPAALALLLLLPVFANFQRCEKVDFDCFCSILITSIAVQICMLFYFAISEMLLAFIYIFSEHLWKIVFNLLIKNENSNVVNWFQEHWRVLHFSSEKYLL